MINNATSRTAPLKYLIFKVSVFSNVAACQLLPFSLNEKLEQMKLIIRLSQ